jgi:mannose-6-phosphate isomerase class I
MKFHLITGSSQFIKPLANNPLLFKYLDAREDLSIQVHPNDALQKKPFEKSCKLMLMREL